MNSEDEAVSQIFCCLSNGDNDEKCTCRSLLQKIGKAVQKLPDTYEECDCSDFECENEEQCELIRLSGPEVDEQVSFIKKHSFAFNCKSRKSAGVRKALGLLLKTSPKTKLYLNDIKLDGIRSGFSYSDDGEVTSHWSFNEFWKGEQDAHEREQLELMLNKFPPKSVEESRGIIAKYTNPCKIGCNNNGAIRNIVQHNLNYLMCALEDLDLVKNTANFLLRQERPGQLWSFDWKDGASFDEKKEEEIETLRGFVQDFYDEQSFNCTCPQNYKYIQLIKKRYSDEIPTFTQYV